MSEDNEEAKQESIEAAMVETIANSDLTELGAEIADSILEDIPIPIFGTLRKLFRSVRTVQGYFFMKKVAKYFREFHDIPPIARRDRLSSILATADEKEKFGAHIALVLDRLNDLDKAALMGKATRALLDGRINLEQLKSLDFAIDAVDIRLVPKVKKVLHGFTIAVSDMQSMANCGLMIVDLNIDSEDIAVGVFESKKRSRLLKSAELKYSPTDLARLFVRICIEI